MYHKFWSYGILFLWYGTWQMLLLFLILGYFLPFHPFALFCPFTRKMKISKKWKKTLGDIIILHKFTKNHDHMQYCSWDMARGGCNYFSFWAIFCPFTAQKNQNFKKMKKFLKILSFYTCAPKIMIRWCTVPEKWCNTDRRTEKVTHRGGCPT